MSNIKDKKQQQQLAEKLVRTTHFTKFEIECLLKHYRLMTNTKMDRGKFQEILLRCFDMTDDIMMDRVFRAFDQDNDSYISMEEWVRGLSVFLRGELEEQIKFCFVVYDLNSDGYISREEMFQMLKTSLVRHSNDEDPDEHVKELVEITLKKMDYDHDNRLSYSDYEESVKNEELLLESFGQCLPCDKYKERFESRFVNEIPTEQRILSGGYN